MGRVLLVNEEVGSFTSMVVVACSKVKELRSFIMSKMKVVDRFKILYYCMIK